MASLSATGRRSAPRSRAPRWERRFVAVFAAVGLLIAAGGIALRWHSLYVWNLERQSIPALQKRAAGNHANPWAALILGRKLNQAGRAREAVEAFGDGLRRLQTRDDPKLRALLDGELALTLVSLGEPQTARPYMHKALELDPGNVPAQMALGWFLFVQGRHAFAAQQFQLVTQLEPRYAPAWYAAGRALLEARKRSEAERVLRTAVELEPKQAAYHLALGDALAVQSRLDEAEQSFATALRLSPHSSEAKGALARARTLKAKTAAEYRSARAELEPLVRESNDETFLAHIGVLDAQFGELKSAEKYLRRAIELVPTNPETNYALAMVLRRQKRDREAEQTLARFRRLEKLHRRVVELEKRLPHDPNNVTMHFEYASGLEEQREWADAMAQYRLIVKRFPGQKKAQKRLAELEQRFGPLDQPAAGMQP